ncbi:MAG TPA: nicotinate phosphoribosyltransferase [Steroidobacteraceae bacterium]|nr:nicotinate phosphoribosyltransferase [Steroidobacteraceae bacterium]
MLRFTAAAPIFQQQAIMDSVNPSVTSASALLTDFYQLTMLDAYYKLGMEDTAVFEFFVRRLPRERNFLVCAGVDSVLDYLTNLRFSSDDLAWLESTERFDQTFLDRLASWRFTGDVYAMREGNVFFESEPVLRVTAPLPEAQFIESRLINLLHYQIVVASKAARCRLAAGDAKLIDFGMRRAHGAEAALLASRACYIAGFDSTATVEAARRYGIPVSGTVAHSFIQAHINEVDAFRNIAKCAPKNLTLLIDTYNTATAARRVVALARELHEQGVEVSAVRIDSGDLLEESKRVRSILDGNGGKNIRILASSGLDEHEIARLQAAGAPIDVYCVGTHVAVSRDAPALDCAYKLQQYAGRATRKLSIDKETWPGPREVFRQYDPHGLIATDVLGCLDENIEGTPQLRRVMSSGKRTCSPLPLAEIREHCKEQLAQLPVPLRSLGPVRRSPVKVSAKQHALAAEVARSPH